MCTPEWKYPFSIFAKYGSRLGNLHARDLEFMRSRMGPTNIIEPTRHIHSHSQPCLDNHLFRATEQLLKGKLKLHFLAIGYQCRS